jgi:YesN/AraC family two-component response regulator
MARILVVDDEETVREMVTKMIQPAGHEVIEATNGSEARDACNDGPVDLIITDIVMPKKNGIDLIMDVKKNFPDIPVIAISGGGGITGRYDYLEIAKLVGAKNILKKPFSMADIRSAVDDIINKKEQA